jgi:DNA-binding beta-propeller fold protein YncE
VLFRSGLKALLCALALMTCAAATAVADTSYAPAGSFATTVGSGDGEVSSPQGVAVETSTGNVFVVDRDNNRVQLFAPDGSNSATYLAQFGAGVVDQPSAIALDQTNGDV